MTNVDLEEDQRMKRKRINDSPSRNEREKKGMCIEKLKAWRCALSGKLFCCCYRVSGRDVWLVCSVQTSRSHQLLPNALASFGPGMYRSRGKDEIVSCWKDWSRRYLYSCFIGPLLPVHVQNYETPIYALGLPPPWIDWHQSRVQGTRGHIDKACGGLWKTTKCKW